MSPAKNTLKHSASSADPRALPALYRIASLGSRATDPQNALSAILADMVDVFGAFSGSISLLDPDTGRLDVEVHHNLIKGEPDVSLHLGRGVTGWVALRGQPLLIPDVSADSRYIAIRPEVRCEMAAPMEGNGQILGVINLDHDHVGAFNEKDLSLFVMLTREATSVITRLWQLRQLQGKARQLESLISIGQTLVTKVEPQELFTTIASDARQITQSHTCALYLYHPDRNAITVAALVTDDENTAKNPGPSAADIPVADSLVASVIHTRRQLDFGNVRSPEFNDLDDIPTSEKLRSTLATPMIYEGEILGVLSVFTDRVHRFNNDEKRLLSALASLAAVAIQNARLYSRVFESEALLYKNEKLTTLGLLAAEIAHEIRNPLTVIKLLYGYLGLDFPANDPRRTDVRVIGEKLDQLEAIVTRVLSFAKAPVSLHSRWPVAEIIDDTVVLVRLKLAQSNIRLNYEPPARTMLVNVHKGQIQQVLLNLLLNSMQAMPDGGTITISAKTGEQPGDTQAGDPAAAKAVHITLTDTGNGIPEHVSSHIFDSFLSGRPEGTGLGLAIAKRILLSHHGDITLVKTGREGTSFRVTLPMAG